MIAFLLRNTINLLISFVMLPIIGIVVVGLVSRIFTSDYKIIYSLAEGAMIFMMAVGAFYLLVSFLFRRDTDTENLLKAESIIFHTI